MARPKVKIPSPGAPAAETHAGGVLAHTSPAPWWIAFAFLAALALALIWLPLARISAHYEIGYNEGWNAYLQQAVAGGGRIYGQAPALVYANYPPVSFHLVGLLGRLTNDVNGAGRWVSLVSFFALAFLIGSSVRRLTGSLPSAGFAALTAVIFIGALKSDRIGMNDPHLLGMAFIAFGFYSYLRASESARWLYISAVAFAIGLFTKQSLMAFPAAVGIHLLLTSKKRFTAWLAAAGAASVVLLVLALALDGPHFLEHLMLPRVYSYAFFLSNTVWYLLMFQAAIVISLAWCFRNPGTSLLVWAFALSHALAFWFAAGSGADLNHLFDPIVSLAMIGGLALPYAVWASQRVRFGSALLTVLLVVPFSLGVLTMLAPRIQEDAATYRAIPQLERDFAGAVEFVKSQPGPALCESLLLCFEAGKPEEYDAFTADQLVKTGKVPEAAVLRMLDERHFSTVQLVMDPGEPLVPAERPRFSQPFMTRLLADYRPAMRTSSYTIFTPAR